MHKRVPMGANKDPEIFQMKMTELFRGLESVKSIQDDIIVYGTHSRVRGYPFTS